MTSTRRIALLGGLAYLATFIFSLPAVALLSPATDHLDFVLGVGNENQVLLGGVFELITAFACVATAIALFPVIRRGSHTLSLGFLSSRIVEAGLILVGVVSILSVVTLRQDLGTASDAPAGLVAVSQGLVDVRAWTFSFGPGIMPAFNALFLGTILFRSGLVPRALPIIGFIGAPLLVIKTMAVTFGGLDDVSVVAGLFALPIAVWELGLALWLTFKGFRRSPVLEPDVADV